MDSVILVWILFQHQCLSLPVLYGIIRKPAILKFVFDQKLSKNGHKSITNHLQLTLFHSSHHSNYILDELYEKFYENKQL